MTEEQNAREQRIAQLELELARAEERCIALRADLDAAKDEARVL